MLLNIFKKKKLLYFIIFVIVIIIGVYFYQKSLEHFESYEEDELFEDKDIATEQERETEDSSIKKFIFIKEKSCENFGHKQITDSETCKEAAKQLNSDWKYKFKQIEDKFDESRPRGCAKHPIGNLDFFGENKSSGVANVTGYEGVYCIQKKEQEKVGFEKWLDNRVNNLEEIKNINCEDIDSIKKNRYENIIKNLSKKNKEIESKISKISDKIETAKDGNNKRNYENQKKKFQERQTKLLELTGKTQKIINEFTKTKTEEQKE
jgi:hypothetical protein